MTTLKKQLLFICITLSSISFSQTKYRIVGLTNESEIYMKADDTIDAIDYEAPIKNDSYSLAVKDTLEYFNKNVKLNNEVEQLKIINSKISKYLGTELEKKEKKELKKEIQKFLKQNSNKRYDGSVSSLITVNTFDYSEELKNNNILISKNEKEIESNQEKILRTKEKALYEISLTDLEMFPKVKKIIPTLVKVSDLSLIKGIYSLNELVYISNTYDIVDEKQKGEFLNGKETNYNNQYKKIVCYLYQNTDGTGIDFYSKYNRLDYKYLQDVNASSNKNEILDKNNILAKMKIYKGQMNSLIDGMSKYRSNPTLAKESARKGQILQKKINALYGNNDDNYYDFLQLLDMSTKEIMVEFNQVLGGAVILFRL